MFKNGEGVSQNYEKSFSWFSLSAKQGYVFAQTLLGYMYENGYGVIQSDVDAYMWFYIAASKNDPDGIILLGLIQNNMSGLQILNGDLDESFYIGIKQWINYLLNGYKKFIFAGNDAHGNFNKYRQINIPMFSIKESNKQMQLWVVRCQDIYL